ncbi:O-methyltransferase [uncultured Jatrophihabitans sp.]|uniref:O-methyltransferase n=1 Tax=uncultured Jatrophihabitans sp. TaxID=1610747 RepID=UPI0035CA77A2
MAHDPRPVTPLGILTALLADLVGRVDAAAPDQDLGSDLRHAHALAQGIDSYVEQCTTPQSTALHKLACRTQEEDWAQHKGDGPELEQEMLSGHVEGQILKMLVHATRARRVLEIGMFTGYSALAMAEALPPDGEVVACELDPYAADLARRCFDESPDGNKIDVRVGPALDTLSELAAASDRFDLVFIDADKAGYRGYLDALLSSDLLAPHALVCVDNTLMQGQPWGVGTVTDNGAAIVDFNRAVADDPRVEQVLVPVRDGLTLVRRVD